MERRGCQGFVEGCNPRPQSRGRTRERVSPISLLPYSWLTSIRLLYGEQFSFSEAAQKDDFVLPFGKAKIERAGKDLTIVSLSRCVGQSLTAAEQLKKKYGIEAEVINLRSVKPLDVEAIVKSVKKTGHLMAVESGFPSFGVAAEILALTMEYAFDYLDAPAVRVTGAEVPTPYAQQLEEMSFPNEDLIAKYAAKLLRV